MTRYKSIVIIFLLSCTLVQSVVAQDYKRQYRTAKEFYLDEQYSLAMEAFKPLIVYDKENPYVEYASFYYSLSAYHQNYISVAKDMLLQIKELYPKWDQMPEVHYWLAKLYFDQKQYFQAMQMLNVFPNLFNQQEVDLMKAHYLNEIGDPETLRMMWENYPQDKVVGKALANAISKQPYLEQDIQLLDSLIATFKLDRDEFASSLKPANVFKEKYIVSALFPFLAKTLEPTTSTKVNQNVLDLYQGMKLATDSLRTMGINIDLRMYDTERNNATTIELLAKEELKASDLLVGPLFPGQIPLVQEFSINNKINMISPVSNNSSFIGENPFGLLFQPSSETMAERSAELVAAQIPNKNLMIFYSDTQKDTLAAQSFKRKAEELGLTVVWSEKVTKENSTEIFSRLATPVEYDEFKNPIEFELKLDSIGSIFVASDDPLVYTKIISGVETRGDSVIIVGNESWLNNAAASFETYERLRMLMAAPTFSHYNNPNFKAFRRDYIKRHSVVPNEFAKVGYEFMWFVGQNLHKRGVYFQEGLREVEFEPGFLFRGYDFRNGHSNQYVPFIYFREGQLHFLNNTPGY